MLKDKKPVSLSLEELKDKQCLYIDNTDDGFKNQNHYFISGSEKELKNFLIKKIDENGIENTYVDFYYSELNNEERKKANSVLNQVEIDYIENTVLDEKNIYFQITPELFEITFKLSISEMLFSSYYFSKYPCTVWSNYNHKFIIFE